MLACLATLARPRYGYALLETLADAGFAVDGNTLYPLLRRLEKQGLLTSQWNTDEARPRKFYSVSPDGAAVLDQAQDRMALARLRDRRARRREAVMTTRTATTLTDRYVWTVTRHLPADVGPDVAREPACHDRRRRRRQGRGRRRPGHGREGGRRGAWATPMSSRGSTAGDRHTSSVPASIPTTCGSCGSCPRSCCRSSSSRTSPRRPRRPTRAGGRSCSTRSCSSSRPRCTSRSG